MAYSSNLILLPLDQTPSQNSFFNLTPLTSKLLRRMTELFAILIVRPAP